MRQEKLICIKNPLLISKFMLSASGWQTIFHFIRKNGFHVQKSRHSGKRNDKDVILIYAERIQVPNHDELQ